MTSCKISVLLIIAVGFNFECVSGHGMLLDPVARGSRWRFNESAPTNYDDNQGFCGGFYVHWNLNKGLCGLCGDSYEDRPPRPHELNGLYGEGVVVKSYPVGSLIHIAVKITANHKGYFKFDLCDSSRGRESEDCFRRNPLKVHRGEGYKYVLPSDKSGWFNTTVQLPSRLECKHCVLRWTYVTGNSWNLCDNNFGALGCGPQEHFVGCSDISILRGISYELPEYDYYSYEDEDDNTNAIDSSMYDMEDICYNLYREKLKDRICNK